MSLTRDTSERRQQISALVRQHGSVQVAPLAEQFGVSMQTIRKDLHYLARRGIAERSYGGAILASSVNVIAEPGVEAKRTINIDEKARIGQLAAAMVAPGESVVLDSGTTALQVARHLPDHDDITVLTNDLDILAALARKQRINVVALGGTLRRKNLALYGAHALEALDNLHVDKLFLGVDGFDVERGITTHFEPEALLNRKMVRAARQVIAITDQTKFGRICLHRIIDLAQVDDLVIDGPLPAALASAAERLGIRVHSA